MEHDKRLFVYEMVRNARVQGVLFAWDGCDAGSGTESDFFGIIDNDR